MSTRFENPLQGFVGYQLRRASAAAMEELARDLGSVGLRPTEASVLLFIGANPQLKPIEIGRELGIQRPNMSPLVAGLESKGLVVREAMDGRSQGLSLTAAGLLARDLARDLMHAHDARLLSRLANPDAPGLASTLLRLWSQGSEVRSMDGPRSFPEP